MDILREIYLNNSTELDKDLAQSARYAQLLDEFNERIQKSVGDKKEMQEFDVLLGKISAVIAEHYGTAGIRFGAKLMRALLYEKGE